MSELSTANIDRPVGRKTLELCQLLASTLDLDTFLARLMEILICHGGGDLGAIVLPDKNHHWQIRSIATPQSAHFIDLPLKYVTELPVKAIEYVIEKQSILNIDRLTTELPIIDRYLERVQPQSLLCLPLINEGELVGIIYLHHQTSAGIFTGDRLSFLSDIARQTAISLVNICLYQSTLERGRSTDLAFQFNRRMAADLAQTKQKYLNLIQSIDGVVWEYDFATDKFLFASDRAVELFGYPLTAWLERPHFWRDCLLYPDDRHRAIAEFDAAIQGCRHCELEYRMVAADGRIIWVYDVSTIVFADGQAIATTGLLIDITERKSIELALQHANDCLEVANHDLQQATRLKSEFVAAIGHELRTPLNAILGMSANLQASEPSPSQVQPLATLERNGRKLLALINSLIDFSQLESGTIDFNPTDISIAQLASISLQAIDTKAYLKQIRLALSLPPHLPQVLADGRLLYRVLLDLLDNAIKFTPTGGRVSLSANIQADSSISISIADTGIGIAEIDRGRLFQPFTQLDGGLDRHYSGTGLGLALADRIIKLHDGTISVAPATTNKINPGTCLTINLPASRTIATIHPEVSASTRSESPSPRSPVKVLLVKENRAKLDTISSYLCAKGYVVVTASHESVVARAIEFQPDTICLDFDRSGIERLRQEPCLSSTAIVAFIPTAVDRDIALAAGATECAIEPLRLQQLLSIIGGA